MAVPAMLAVAAMGTAAKSYGQYLEAKAAAKTYREKAQVSLLQSDEVLRRADINSQVAEREGKRFGGEQLAQYAASGVSVDSNAALGALEDTASSIADEIIKTKTEALFEARMLRREALSYGRAARDAQKAGLIGALGGAALGGADLYAKGQ